MTKEEHDELRSRLLEDLGLDPDRYDDIREFRKDIEWAHVNRKRCETLAGKVIVYIALILTGATTAIFWDGLKVKMGIQ